MSPKPKLKNEVTLIDDIEIHPWIQVSPTEWIGSAYDHRFRVGHHFGVVFTIYESMDHYVWEAKADRVEKLPEAILELEDGFKPFWGGAVAVGENPARSLQEAQQTAENAALMRYDLSLAFKGWKRPDGSL